MVRPGRAAVEVLLWLGVLAGLSLLLVWWDVRPGSAVDYDPSEGNASSLFAASFLLTTALTALVLWLGGNPSLGRLAAAVTGLAMIVSGGAWSDVEGTAFMGPVMWVGGLLLWVLPSVALPAEGEEPRPPIRRTAAAVLTVVLVPLVGYGLLVLAVAEADRFPAALILVLALLVAALRMAISDLVRGRREDVAQVTENEA